MIATGWTGTFMYKVFQVHFMTCMSLKYLLMGIYYHLQNRYC